MHEEALASKPDVDASICNVARQQENWRAWADQAKAIRNRFGAWVNTRGLRHRDFTVLSNDCWAETLYDDWGLPCKTPFRGLGMAADCFIEFLGDIERYIREPVRFIPQSKHELVNRWRARGYSWPIGLIGGDVEIYFVHYLDEDEARRAWEEGCRSINLDRIAVKLTVDKDGIRPEHVAQFAALPFRRKLVISKRPYAEIPCAVETSRFHSNGALLFRRSLRHFDCAHWLNTGEIRRVTPRVLLNKLIYLRGV